MFMCVVNLKSVNKLDLTWKQSFLIVINSRKDIHPWPNVIKHFSSIIYEGKKLERLFLASLSILV